MSRLPEVLAPAGSPAALEAAVLCGADAVYLGAGAFNARRGAENFTLEHLADTVRRCHIRGVRVYLTLNIVVLEDEIPQFLSDAEAACAAGVDAVIVQDAGAAALLRRCAPSLRLHGSTQMVVHNAEGAKMLEEMGFSRVVLARECSKEEIGRIIRATSLEVETFVHGALCMSVSGQCYMSAVLGQRSGNRGLCAQPCRLPCKAGNSEHALSLKDMSIIGRAEELRELGVSALKIEGRMKRPEYVAAAVTACRRALAGEPVDLETLQSVFSRSGFTDGYFEGRLGAEMFGIRQKEDVTAAAGVLGSLETLYTDPRRQVQKVEADFCFTMKAGEPSRLTVTDGDGNATEASGEVPQAAVNRPTDPERAAASLSKTGGTPYRVRRVSCEIEEGLMLPASAVNALRREALGKLDELRGETRAVPFDRERAGAPRGHAPAPAPALRVRAYSARQLTPEMLKGAELVTLPVPALVKLCETGAPAYADKLCAGLPRILFSGQEALREQLALLREKGIRHAAVGNPGAVRIAGEAGFTLHGEPFLNAMNSHTAETLAGWGLCDLLLSFEAALDMAKKITSPIPLGLTAYGRLPLMTVRCCPVKSFVGCARCKKGENFLTDRRGETLYTSCAYGCSEILNPVPLFMGDRLAELRGLDFIELRFSTESPEECGKLFETYRSGGEFHGKFTRGLLYKTVR